MDTREEIKRKWRVQSCNEYGANMVAYIDARDVSKALDKLFKKGWSNEFKEIGGKLFCRITDLETGAYHEDVGTESNIEKQKGQASDAFKRAAVHFGIGRDNYDLPAIKLDSKEFKGKFYPVNKNGKFLKREELYNECEKRVQNEK